ncbi:MAG: hypothetical protein QG670_981, partial [Thermoproteota archaeon]|nr:hypothetical protein [Thermoproteota archaeon]
MKLRWKSRAVEPIISTLILMAVMMLAISVSLTFVQQNLNLRGAQNDFASMETFMRTVGLQVDDVAWVTGRTETTRYTTQFGHLTLSDPLIQYSIDVGRKSDPVLWIQTSDTDFGSGIFDQTKTIGSGNDTLITLDQYTAPRFLSDYIDNNMSNVDSSPGLGSHSSFNSQKATDSIYDTLTEQSVGLASIYSQVTVSAQQTTSITSWQNVPGATVSFTPRSSTEEWLVIVTADIRSNSVLENQAQFRYIINAQPEGETGVMQGTTSSNPIDPYNVYFHFSKVTGTTSQQTVKFQFQASSGRTAYTRNVHILCIRLDWAGLQYTEFNGDTIINGTVASPQTLVNLQFTPSSSGNYIVMYSSLISKGTWAGAETWLNYDNGTAKYPNAWTTPNTRRIHTDYAQFEPHGIFMNLTLSTSPHSLKVQSQLRTAGDTSIARDVRIAAFRIDAFDSLESKQDIGVSSTTGSTTVRSSVTTANPGEQRDYLILAGIETISSGTTNREAGGIRIDGTTVQSKGDKRLPYAECARIASQYVGVKTSSTSFLVETTFGRGGGSAVDTIYSK